MGIEQDWNVKGQHIPQVIMEPIPAQVWDFAHQFLQHSLQQTNKGKKLSLPCKISKKELLPAYREHLKKVSPNISEQDLSKKLASFNRFNHSFIAIADPHSNHGGYKLGVIPSGKKEGVEGFGSAGKVKAIFWEDGTKNSLKIEPETGSNTSTSNKDSDIIARDIGGLIAEFTVGRPQTTPWIGKKKIKNKKYSIIPYYEAEMKKYLDNTPLDFENRTSLALLAALELKKMHDKNYIHCDIKPENFMLNINNGKFEVGVVDFGLAKILPRGKTFIQREQFAGTAGYVAPEIAQVYDRIDDSGQIIDHKIAIRGLRYSKSSDIYALGIILMENLNLAEKDSPLRPLIERMLDPNSNNRPNIDEVVDTLKHADLLKINAQLERYKKNQEKDSASSFPRTRENAKARIKAGQELQTILTNYKKIVGTLKSTPAHSQKNVQDMTQKQDDTQKYAEADKQAIEKFLEEASSAILKTLVDNQERHNKAYFSTWSNFNLETVQNLPLSLKTKVLDKLGILANDPILSENTWYNWNNRRKFAAKINDYQRSQHYMSPAQEQHEIQASNIMQSSNNKNEPAKAEKVQTKNFETKIKSGGEATNSTLWTPSFSHAQGSNPAPTSSVKVAASKEISTNKAGSTSEPKPNSISSPRAATPNPSTVSAPGRPKPKPR